MNILLKGYYGFGNLGDDILMITVYKILKDKFPEATFSIFSNHTVNLDGFSQHQHYNHYIFNLLKETPQLIDWTYQGRFDVVVDGGGGVYFDCTDGNLLYRFRNTILRILGIRIVTLVDKVLRKAISRPKRLQFDRRIGVGLGLGPYTQGAPLYYDHLVELGSYQSLIVRDRVSHSLLKDLGFPGKKHLSSDVAFLNEYWLPQAMEVPRCESFSGKIGVVLMDSVRGNEDTFEEFERYAEEAGTKGMKVTFFSLDENNDKRFRSFFEGRFPFVSWKPEAMSLATYLMQLGQQDVLITSRAHGAILGAQLGVIPVCLGVSQKLVQVGEMFPTGGVLLRSSWTSSDCHEAVDRIAKNYRWFCSSLREDVAANRKLAARGVDVLKSYL